MYNELLEQQTPHDVEIIGYADDIAITTSGLNKEHLEILFNLVFEIINTCMGGLDS